MSAVDDIVTSSTTIKDASISQQGFGTPLLAAYHNYWAARVMEFSSPDDMTVAPYSVPVTSPLYLWATAVKSQKPSPSTFKIGKRLLAFTQIMDLTPLTPAPGDIYSLNVDGQPVSVTADGTPTVAEICTALQTAIAALTVHPTAVDATTKVTCTSAAGVLHKYDTLSSNLKLKNVTTDPGIATDLAAIKVADADWYHLSLDSNSQAEIVAGAVWAEANVIIFGAQSSDTEQKNPASTSDVMYALQTAGYTRTYCMWHEKPEQQFATGAWSGLILPKTIGSATWANKALAGVDKSVLNDTERHAIDGKNGNYYVSLKKIGFTFNGKAASGRFLDITQGIDWFNARLVERYLALLANNDKIPYTDEGADLMRNEGLAQIAEAGRVGLADLAQAYAFDVPRVATQNPNDKTARIFNFMTYSFVLQGAVHKMRINGTVKV